VPTNERLVGEFDRTTTVATPTQTCGFLPGGASLHSAA
jgi:hypothetical protein